MVLENMEKKLFIYFVNAFLSVFSIVECPEGSFGPECQYFCTSCMNRGRCNERGDGCECRAGWTGLLCNETCPSVTCEKHLIKF